MDCYGEFKCFKETCTTVKSIIPVVKLSSRRHKIFHFRENFEYKLKWFMDTISSDAFTWKWTLKESGAQDLFSDDFRTFDTSFVNGYRFYFSNHLQASLFLLLCYYLSLLCWKWITFVLVCKNGNIYFHYKRNIILWNSYKDEKKSKS